MSLTRDIFGPNQSIILLEGSNNNFNVEHVLPTSEVTKSHPQSISKPISQPIPQPESEKGNTINIFLHAVYFVKKCSVRVVAYVIYLLK